ncbi:hypothetical protein [Desulfovibrio sp.]|uniref:hypothetical protein n=1 Tax=Desulfovibrio sp. TaxID=885 RepID=UPI0023BEAE6A|nr:hypothetical protein [Desulfovibrio sp.]MDE7240281.1 hypothetical protein [Desulfovibrio sp.]
MSAEPEQPMSYRRALLAFGNGDLGRGQQNLFMLARRLEEARRKHSVFAGDRFEAVRVISREFHELCYAVTHESHDRRLDEALDVATTAMRFVNGEHMTKRKKRA